MYGTCSSIYPQKYPKDPKSRSTMINYTMDTLILLVIWGRIWTRFGSAIRILGTRDPTMRGRVPWTSACFGRTRDLISSFHWSASRGLVQLEGCAWMLEPLLTIIEPLFHQYELGKFGNPIHINPPNAKRQLASQQRCVPGGAPRGYSWATAKRPVPRPDGNPACSLLSSSSSLPKANALASFAFLLFSSSWLQNLEFQNNS